MLLVRGLRERKHESYSGLRIFQVMSVSILSGLLWWHSDTSHIQDQVTPLLQLLQDILLWSSVVTILLFHNLTGGTSLLFLNFLGILPFIQCHICLPSRKTNANKRKIFINVPSLLLLLCTNSWRFTNGTDPPNHLCNDHILDGRPQAIISHIFTNTVHYTLQCVSFPGIRPRPRSHSDGP